jgi:LAO/AO transport system kinase
VLQPLAGDHVQFLKAGVMEIPDAFVLSKCDEEKLARRAHAELKASLRSAGLTAIADAPVMKTSAVTGDGVGPLADWVLAALPRPGAARARERFFLAKEIVRAYGEFGARELARLAEPADGPGWFEAAESAAFAAIAGKLRD